MPSAAAILLPYIRRWAGAPAVDGLPDRELLRRFTRDRDGQAFAALLRRHGPMAWAACRRILPRDADAEDVLQKTFLLLAQKAAGLRDHDSVGGWLYGVAYRLALRARSEAAVRADRESRTPPRSPSDPLADITRRETQQLFDEALAWLPEKFRAVLVVCCLEGRTQGEAARQLGCSLRTLKRRLEEGRTRLGQQLVRSGVTLPAAALAATLAPRADAALPPALTAAVLRAVTGAPVADLVGRGVSGLLVSRRRFAVAALAIPVAVAAGGVAFWATSRPPAESVLPDPPLPVPGRVVPRPGFDLAGDPLPAGAIARIGTTRFRYAGSITSLVFTADGKRLLSFESNGTRENNGIRVWDLATGDEQRTQVAEVEGGLSWDVSSLSSGAKLAATTHLAGATIWDLTSGKKVKDIGHGGYDSNDKVRGHMDDLTCLAPDGRVLALAGNNAVSTWDVATGERLATLRHPGKRRPYPTLAGRERPWPYFLAFTGDGKTLMTDGDENAVFVWEAATGNMLRRLDGIAARDNERTALSADGKMIAGYAPELRKLCIFDADGEGLRPLESPVNGISRLAFSPDGKVLACADRPEPLGNVVYLWDTATGKELARLAPLGRKDQYTLGRLMAFSPDGTRLAMTLDTMPGTVGGGGPDWQVIQVYDVASGKELPLTAGLPKKAWRTALAPDGKTLATSWAWFMISSVCLWDPATGEQRLRLEGLGGGSGPNPLFSPDGRTLYAGARAWDVATGRQLQIFDPGNGGVVVACSPDGKRLAVAAIGGDFGSRLLTVKVIDTTTGELACKIDLQLRPMEDRPPMWEDLYGATFLPDGRSLVVCTGRQAHVYDVTTGKDTRHFEMAMGGHAFDTPPAFTPDGRLVAFLQTNGPQNGYIEVHGLPDGARVCRSEKPTDCSCLALSPDGRTVAWGLCRSEPLVHLLDVATGKERHTFAGHLGGVQTLTFSADGKKLVSGGSDATLLVWDMTAPPAAPGSGQPEKPISPRKAPPFHQWRPTGTARG